MQIDLLCSTRDSDAAKQFPVNSTITTCNSDLSGSSLHSKSAVHCIFAFLNIISTDRDAESDLYYSMEEWKEAEVEAST